MTKEILFIDNTFITYMQNAFFSSNLTLDTPKYRTANAETIKGFLEKIANSYDIVIADSIVDEATRADHPFSIAMRLLRTTDIDGNITDFAGFTVTQTDEFTNYRLEADLVEQRYANGEISNNQRKSQLAALRADLGERSYDEIYESSDINNKSRTVLLTDDNNFNHKMHTIDTVTLSEDMLRSGDINSDEALKISHNLQEENHQRKYAFTQDTVINITKENRPDLIRVSDDGNIISIRRSPDEDFTEYTKDRLDTAFKHMSGGTSLPDIHMRNVGFTLDEMTEIGKNLGTKALKFLGPIGIAVGLNAVLTDAAQAHDEAVANGEDGDTAAYNVMAEDGIILFGEAAGTLSVAALAGLVGVFAGIAVTPAAGFGLLMATVGGSLLGGVVTDAYKNDLLDALESNGLITPELKNTIGENGNFLASLYNSVFTDLEHAAEQQILDTGYALAQFAEHIEAFLNDNLPSTPPSADMAGARGWFLEALLNVRSGFGGGVSGDPLVIDLDGDGCPARVNTRHIIFNKPVNNNYKLLRAA